MILGQESFYLTCRFTKAQPPLAQMLTSLVLLMSGLGQRQIAQLFAFTSFKSFPLYQITDTYDPVSIIPKRWHLKTRRSEGEDVEGNS